MPSPSPLSEQEEFEFRLRAEAEGGLAGAPPKINGAGANAPSDATIDAANREANRTEHGPVQDVIDNIKGLASGAGGTLEGIGNMVAHPIDSASRMIGAVPDVARGALNAVQHPIDEMKATGSLLRNATPTQVGELEGSTLAGGAAGKAAGVVGDVAGPAIKEAVGLKPVSQTVRDLANKGVVTTPGQRGGKLASGLEQRLTSVPIAGDAIKSARGKATEQWNRAELNDVIKDAGGKPLPKERTGRDAIFHAENEIHEGYDRVLPKMQGSLDSAGADGVTFRQKLSDGVGNNRKLDAEHSKLVHTIIDDDIIAKFKESGGYTRGDTIKEIQETLRTEADGLRRGTYQERQAALVIDQIRTDFLDMLKRENPKLAKELSSVDRAYAKFKTIARASTYSTKAEGGFTPAQKLRSIKARDESKDKRRFASGRAHGQKDTEAVEKVLGNTEPDSGSAGRLMSVEALLHPVKAAGLAATSPLYSQTVLKRLQNRALKRGGPYKPISGRKAARAGAALAAPGSVDQNGVGQ